MDNNNLEFKLPQDAYVNFDAVSLKSFMIQRLNEGGIFTDQGYEGSNMSALIELLSYYTHVLMFYLNQTSSETMFSQATIYENMNKIVKLVNYKPTGKQTSMVSIDCTAASTLGVGNYIIPKYSYFLIDNVQYTFKDDVSFEKSNTSTEKIQSISDNAILYQGTVGEYPLYIAEGVEYEVLPIVVDNLVSTKDTRFISDGNISVYVKEVESGTWIEYEEADSLFISSSTSRIYEVRLNENGHYEIKFGNGIFGRKLTALDEVAVYYILSDGQSGQISKNSINGNKLFTFNSNQFSTIYSDVSEENSQYIISSANRSLLTFNNPSNSTIIQDAETVDQIRDNVPSFLSTQLRLVTESDYERFLKKNIPNILNSVKVVNNNLFITEYIDYFYKICIDPNKVNRVVLNQANFADTCDFNNVNIFCVPTFTNTVDEFYPDYLSNSFKNLIKSLTEDKKIISNEVVPRDPVYVAIDIGFTNKTVTKDCYNNSKIIAVREKNDKTNKETLKVKISKVITDYFNPTNMELGQVIDTSEIASRILSISGIKSIKTYNSEEFIYFDGVSFVIWNPIFDGVDESLINQTTKLPFFKFPYLYRPTSLVNHIEVIDE